MKRRIKRHRKVLVVLAALVVFATTYALTLPAVTLDQDAADQAPGVQAVQEKLQASTDSYEVTAAYGKDAQLPDDAKLSVREVKEDSTAYEKARDAVIAAKKDADKDFDESELGMQALDISILDGNGKEVEPQGKVQVTVAMKNLPKNGDDRQLEVQHLVEKPSANAKAKGASDTGESAAANDSPRGNGNDNDSGSEASGFDNGASESTSDGGDSEKSGSDDSGSSADEAGTDGSGSSDADAASASNADSAESSQNAHGGGYSSDASAGADVADGDSSDASELVAETVATQVVSADRQATAEFTVESFSIFTVTWNTSNNARIGSVRIHYVDGSGNELAEPQETPKTRLAESGVLSLQDWALKDGADGKKVSRIDGYQIADTDMPGHLGSPGGDPVSCLKVVQDGTSYKLLYTPMSAEMLDGLTDDDWANYSETSGGNNADIYLVYAMNITVHYVDLDGKDILNESGKPRTETFDISTEENGLEVDFFSIYADDDTHGIDGYDFVRRNANLSSGSKATINTTNGSEFRYIKYQYRGDAGSSDTGSGAISYRSSTGDDWTTSGTVTDVYLFYCPVLRIHYVDQRGNDLQPARTTFAGSQGETAYPIYKVATPANGDWPNGYSLVNNSPLLAGMGEPAYRTDQNPGDPENTSPRHITRIAWADDNGTWKTQLKIDASGSSSNVTQDGCVTDIYYVYNNNFALSIHRIGNVLQNVYRSVSNGTTINANSSELALDGFAVSGIYLDAAQTQKIVSITFNQDENGTWTSVVADEAGNTSSDTLYTGIYVSYDRIEPTSRNIVVHSVDENGEPIADSKTLSSGVISSENPAFRNRWDGSTIKQDENAANVPDYSYSGREYIGEPRADESNRVNPSDTKIVWRYDTDTGTWHTGYGTGDNPTEVKDEFGNAARIVDIYFVYTRKPLTIHYVDSNGGKIAGRDVVSIPLNEDHVGTYSLDGTDATYTPEISGMSFLESRAGSKTGPAVSKVRIGEDEDGVLSISYLRNIDTGDHAMSVMRSNVWFYTTSSGRMFTLWKNGDDYTIRDSEFANDSMGLSLQSDDGAGRQVYTASADTSGADTVYTVTVDASGSTAAYSIRAEEWVSSTQTEIYQVYGQGVTATLKDDVAYSGNLIVELDKTLQNGVVNGTVTDVTYTWHRKVAKSGNPATDMEVTRGRSGYDWNIARDPEDRTWLDVAVDGGTPQDTETAVSYYCVVSYKEGGENKTVTTNEVPITYYGKLENGDFENPNFKDSSVTAGLGSGTENGTGNATGGSVSNAWYKANGGVWQTTGTGKPTGNADNQNHEHQDIEIINSNNSDWNQSGYAWYSGSGSDGSGGAESGNQFAELNAETAGALYQDVITRTNVPLNYWLSHRARGLNRNSTPEYDTMYLVIMPTRLALTSGDQGGVLDEQNELASFIQSHGGYTDSLATSVESTITYNRDGILIERISSSDQAWHNLVVANGYVPTSELTRFFFVAGPTTADRGRTTYTRGNFVDNVGFSQELPEPPAERYSLVVNKSFTGLETGDIDKLAENRNADGSSSTNANPFKMTITAYSDEAKQTVNTSDPLNGVELTFEAGSSSGSYTLKATKDGTSVFEGSDSAQATINAYSGEVSMSWAFLNRTIGDNETKYYVVSESGETIPGFSITRGQSAVVTQYGEAMRSIPTSGTSSSWVTVPVRSRGTATIATTNAYRDTRNDGVPFFTVTKTFTGVTSTTVDALIKDQDNPYKVTLTRGNKSLVLTGDASKPYGGKAEDLPTGVKDVALSTVENNDGTVTLTWRVIGDNETTNSWIADGEYRVKEENYLTKAQRNEDNNEIVKVMVNGVEVKLDSDSKAWPSADPTVSVGANGHSGMQFSNENGVVQYDIAQPGGYSAGERKTVAASTNFVTGMYSLDGTAFSGYLVWTSDALGLDDRAAVLNAINERLAGTPYANYKATADNTSFRNGENVGSISCEAGSIGLTYDSGFLDLTFNANGISKWLGFYSTQYKGQGDPEVSIANNYRSLVKIKKTDKNNDSKLLGGAVFNLFQVKDGKRVYVSGEEGDSADKPRDYKTLATSKDGIGEGEVSLGSLEPGDYYLEEMTAPDGFNKLVAPICFNVAENGVVTLKDDANGQGADNSVASVQFSDPYYQLVIKNAPGFVLPNTGGAGDWLFAVGGGVLVAAAALGGLVAYWRKHRWRPRHAR